MLNILQITSRNKFKNRIFEDIQSYVYFVLYTYTDIHIRTCSSFQRLCITTMTAVCTVNYSITALLKISASIGKDMFIKNEIKKKMQKKLSKIIEFPKMLLYNERQLLTAFTKNMVILIIIQTVVVTDVHMTS